MAVDKVLYVTGTTTLDGLRGLTINPRGATLKSSGDNGLYNYAGRARLSGTAIFEDWTTANSAVGTLVASEVVVVKDQTGADAAFTITNFLPYRYSVNVGDGMTSGPVPGISVDWVASSMTLTNP